MKIDYREQGQRGGGFGAFNDIAGRFRGRTDMRSHII
jgi:hypothetical protein